jgi:hypothetical protein
VQDGLSTLAASGRGTGSFTAGSTLGGGLQAADSGTGSGTDSYSSASTVSTGLTGSDGTSVYALSGGSSAGSNGSSTNDSSGTTTLNSAANSSFQYASNSTTASSGTALTSVTETGAGTVALYEAGRYGGGSFALGSYLLDVQSNDSVTLHEQDSQTASTSATDSYSDGSLGSSTTGGASDALLSGSGADGSTNGSQSASESGGSNGSGTVDSSDSGSDTQQQTLTSNFSYTDTGTDAAHLHEEGTFGGGSFALACFGADQWGTDSFTSLDSSSLSATDSFSSTQTVTSTGTATSTSSGTASGSDLADYSVGSGTDSSTAADSVTAGGNGTYQDAVTQSGQDSGTQTELDSEQATSSFTLHQEGTFSGGRMSLNCVSYQQSGTDSYTLSEQSNQSSTSNVADSATSTSNGSQTLGGNGSGGYSGTTDTGLTNGSSQTGSSTGSVTSTETSSSLSSVTSSDSVTLTVTGSSTGTLTEQGFYGNGSLTLTDVAEGQQAASSFTLLEQSGSVATGTSTDTLTSSGQFGSNGSAAGSFQYSADMSPGSSDVGGASNVTTTATQSGTLTSTLADSFQDTGTLMLDQSGTASLTLYQEGQYANGSVSLSSYTIDQTQSGTSSLTQTTDDSDTGSSSVAAGGGAVDSSSGTGSTNLAGVVTAWDTVTLADTQTLAQTDSATFSSDQTSTSQQTSTGTSHLHAEGVYANGSLALGSFGLQESGNTTVTVSGQSTDTFTDTTAVTTTDTALTSAAFGAGSSGTSDSPVSTSVTNNQTTTYSGTGAGSFSAGSVSSYALIEAGSYANNSFTLGSLSYSEGATGTSTQGSAGQRTPSSGDATGSETFDQNSTAAGSYSLSQAGSYTGGQLSLGSTDYDEGGTQAQTLQAQGELQSPTSLDSYSQDSTGSSSYHLHQEGTYGNGSFNLGCYAYQEQDGSTWDDQALGSYVSGSSGSYQQDDGGTSSSQVALTGSYGSGGFNLNDYNQQASGNESSTAAQSVAYAWTGPNTASVQQQSADSYTLYEDGVYGNGSLNLGSYSYTSGANDSSTYQRVIDNGAASFTADDTSSSQQTDTETGSGDVANYQTVSNQASSQQQQNHGGDVFGADVNLQNTQQGTASGQKVLLPQIEPPPLNQKLLPVQGPGAGSPLVSDAVYRGEAVQVVPVQDGQPQPPAQPNTDLLPVQIDPDAGAAAFKDAPTNNLRFAPQPIPGLELPRGTLDGLKPEQIEGIRQWWGRIADQPEANAILRDIAKGEVQSGKVNSLAEAYRYLLTQKYASVDIARISDPTVEADNEPDELAVMAAAKRREADEAQQAIARQAAEEARLRFYGTPQGRLLYLLQKWGLPESEQRLQQFARTRGVEVLGKLTAAYKDKGVASLLPEVPWLDGGFWKGVWTGLAGGWEGTWKGIVWTGRVLWRYGPNGPARVLNDLLQGKPLLTAEDQELLGPVAAAAKAQALFQRNALRLAGAALQGNDQNALLRTLESLDPEFMQAVVQARELFVMLAVNALDLTPEQKGRIFGLVLYEGANRQVIAYFFPTVHRLVSVAQDRQLLV